MPEPIPVPPIDAPDEPTPTSDAPSNTGDCALSLLGVCVS
jgi:hypothetical protein